MVLSDPQGKVQERRRGSVSPSRDRDRRKPRRDWLVAVGQGHSPASTRSRQDDSKSSSSPNKRSKKFDVDSLTFSGLEEQQQASRADWRCCCCCVCTLQPVKHVDRLLCSVCVCDRGVSSPEWINIRRELFSPVKLTTALVRYSGVCVDHRCIYL